MSKQFFRTSVLLFSYPERPSLGAGWQCTLLIRRVVWLDLACRICKLPSGTQPTSHVLALCSTTDLCLHYQAGRQKQKISMILVVRVDLGQWHFAWRRTHSCTSLPKSALTPHGPSAAWSWVGHPNIPVSSYGLAPFEWAQQGGRASSGLLLPERKGGKTVFPQLTSSTSPYSLMWSHLWILKFADQPTLTKTVKNYMGG